MVRCSLIVAALLSFASLTLTQSQQPWTNQHQEETAKFNNSATTEQQASHPQVGTATLDKATTIKDHDQADDKQGNADNEAWYSPSVLVQIGLLVVGVVYSIFAGLQWKAIRRQTASTGTNLRTIERAYVKMSHSGWSLDPLREGEEVLVTMQVKNFGNTPATTTQYLLTYRLCPPCQQLPDEPDYSKGTVQSIEAFLVKGDFFTYSEAFSIPTEEMRSFAGPEPTAAFYLIGYVDYVDRFEIRHRAGYARRYDPVSKDLVFVTQPHYNYDRP